MFTRKPGNLSQILFCFVIILQYIESIRDLDSSVGPLFLLLCSLNMLCSSKKKKRQFLHWSLGILSGNISPIRVTAAVYLSSHKLLFISFQNGKN